MSSSAGRVPADETPATTASLLAPFERDVLLATGRAVRVRPASPRDVERLRSFYQQLDDTSTYSRFFGLRPFIPDDELQRATLQNVDQQVTLIAESDGSIIGVGEYHARPGGVEAEVAFAVADAHHHEGVATVLLEDLALVARAAGFRRLAADTLPGNMAMLGVFRTVGLVHRHWFEDGVVCVQLDLTADDLLQDHADLRDWRAAVRSLRSIVAPSHVVVIGADRDESSPGRRILAHLRDSFSGRVSVVHATAGVVGGINAVATFDELDEVPDLAVIAVPAPLVAGVVAQCGTVGVPSAVVISAGFAELGAEGARMQDQVLVAARRYGMRIVGPNCLGVVSTACGLNATFTGQQFVPGGIAIASQSGGVGIAIAAEAQRRHAGISSFVSMGNKVDVSGNDLLRLWADDEQTNVVLLYLESFGDPVRFARVARAVSQRKPVVALKSGRTAAGRRGAVSHTAAVAADQVVVDALLAHTGVLRAGGLEELIDVGLLLDRQAAPAGRRVALIGNAGGPLVLGADAADAGGLDVPLLSPPLQDEIVGLVPTVASTENPVDLGSAVTADRLAAVVQAVGASGEVDACVVVCVDVEGLHRLDGVEPLVAGVALDGVPVALTLIGADVSGSGSLPVFPTPERAAVAVALAAGRAEWLASIAGDASDGMTGLDASSFVGARRLARMHAGGAAETTWLDAVASFELLEAAGLPIVTWAYARSPDECARAADGIGFPCVVKADAAEVLHESDAGAVRLGSGDPTAAAETYRDFERRFGNGLRGVVVQAQQVAALELLVGVTRDPAFGPLVVVGAGGVEAELRDDRVVLIAPVSRSAARRAVESLRLAPLFHGFRGRAELPVDPVVDLIHRIGMLAATVTEIQRLDLNPVLVTQEGCAAADARIGVAAALSAVGPVRGLRGHPVGSPPNADSGPP